MTFPINKQLNGRAVTVLREVDENDPVVAASNVDGAGPYYVYREGYDNRTGPEKADVKTAFVDRPS